MATEASVSVPRAPSTHRRGGQQSGLRRRNLGRVLREVHLAGPLSRAELCDRLGIDSSTIRHIVHDLSRLRLVIEPVPAEHGAPGRPPRLVSVRPDGPLVLALEVATDSLAAALVGIGGVVRAKTRVARTSRVQDPAALVDALVAIARPLIDAPNVAGRVLAVGISTPGSVRAEDGFVGFAVNLGWEGVPLADLVAAGLGLEVPVRVANDAQMATLAEHIRGSGAGCSDFICVWAEAGIGSGIIASGSPLFGSQGYGGRLGHIPVTNGDRQCHCGSRRCLEIVAGEDALIRYAGRPFDEAGPDAVAVVLAAAEAGSPAALAALSEVGHWLGIGLSAEVELFNPARIALAGMYARLYPFICASVKEVLDEPVLSPSRSLVEVVPAALGADSALMGAAEFALAPYLDDPARVAAAVVGSGSTS